MPNEKKFTQRNMAAGKPDVMNEVIIKKTVVSPVTKKKEGMVDTNVYIIRDPQNEYAYREVKRGTKGAQGMTPSQYAKLKSSVGPMKKG